MGEYQSVDLVTFFIVSSSYKLFFFTLAKIGQGNMPGSLSAVWYRIVSKRIFYRVTFHETS